MLDSKGRARERVVDYRSGEVILEEGEIPSLETIERVGTLRLELVELVLEGLSSNPIGYSNSFYRFLVESRLGLEVIELTFALVGEEDSRYLDLVGLLG